MTRRTQETDGSDHHGEPTVIIVDDDALVRSAMDSLFRSIGLRTLTFDSAQTLFEHALPKGPSCLVMDVRLPRMNGLEIQAKLMERGDRAPIVFITGHGDIPMSVRAMKAGAIDFLAKPFRDQDIIDAVETALDRDRKRLEDEDAIAAAAQRQASLTPREREVMERVVAGLMNKQIAADLGLSEITVKLHRGSMMRKMGVRTVADLVRLSEAIGRRGVPS
ncbi:response regulator transcription factor [Sphingomonas echinoides]|uniref:Response regulator transcription factor n=1 Tax=Sphingomonas echinoides TaxID=59803 RepID=A0ABU4PPZ7_9SPHN|nr:response regulator transcription factor [Sphingomonas echinoides]MDX5986225.1 response regulator transcription factor [Sphingomonas echinoides]